MPGCYHRHIFGLGIVDSYKARHQLVVTIHNGKIFLMFAHGIDQNFVRHFEKFNIKLTDHRDREFNKIIDDIDQLFIRQNATIKSPSDFRDSAFKY